MTKLNLELQIEKFIKILEEVRLNQEKVLLKANETERRLDSIESYAERTYKDRELMLENNESVAGLKQRIIDNHDHVETVAKKSEFETGKQIEEVKVMVEAKIEEVKTDIIKGISKEVTK